jgi:hypothetical protein
MARREGTTPKDGPLVVETFKENGWWILRIDSVPMLQLSDFPWQQKGIWCGLSHTTRIIAKVVDFVADEQGLCEVFMKGFQKGNPSSFVLRSQNMMNSLDVLDSLKFTGLPKVRKWWDALSNEQQVLREDIVRKVSLLMAPEIDRLNIYMSQYERAQILNPESSIVDREFSSSALEDEVIKEGLSYFSERSHTILRLTTIPASNVASGSKRKKTSRLSQSQVGVQDGVESTGLSEFDFEAEPEVINQVRPRGTKLLSDGKMLFSLVKKDMLVLPTQAEIDSGYVFGKEFSFHVDIANVRPASNILTNQHVLNIANVEAVYKRLKEVQFNESHVMTFRPMEYLQPDDGEKYVFKVGESQTNFLRCLNAMEGHSLEEKREKFLSLVILEPVDGQHILHACQ